jgi:putative zinc-binding metallo-peptidase
MHFERTPPEAQALLTRPIRDLGLRLEGSALQPRVEQLYAELEAAGLHRFRPACYLTDEWGCPSGEPVIGIPFYLADPRLLALEDAMNDVEDEREIMMYLRHEAGHAFNYAYGLFRTPEWRQLFGPFRRPYREDYRPVPFSRDYVRHIAGWYAQKHPDEDFAETFAVWLTPGSDWQHRYEGWGAMRKLLYVHRIAGEVGDAEPLLRRGRADVTVEQMETTVEEFYGSQLRSEARAVAALPLDADLHEILRPPRGGGDGTRPAAEMIADHRRAIVDGVTKWTGMRRPLVKALVQAVERRAADLELTIDTGRDAVHVAELTAYLATLATQSLQRGGLTPP